MEIQPSVSLSKREPRYEIVVVGVFFLFATAYFSSGFMQSYRRQSNANRKYIPIAAEVITSSVASRGSNQTTHGGSYFPQITYRYTVNSQKFESSRYFHTGPGWRDWTSAQTIVDRYKPGQTIEAYYNPENPSIAVLDRTKPSPKFFLFLFPLHAFGLLVIFLGFRGRKTN